MTQMFAVIATDKQDHFEMRMQTRPSHLQYWEDNGDAMVLAGPLLGEDGKAMGSMMVVAAADRAEAERVVGADPYALAGVFDSVTITPWNWVIKRPEGM
ncbi:YciI family protein [Pelagibacterium lacus]|uniref:YciI family protein n=1 Tax=Pelagibacterium lacus TaxID=2282655 RepID=A0A369W755_9HYPH|nr:YciI family protein [Pelagibacterium lacus]RDE09685.1 YciI family protein [Pelagibacterium lacus]